MRIIYIHGADIPVNGFEGGFIEMMNTMLASLARHSHVDKVICTLDPSPDKFLNRIKCPWPAEYIQPSAWKEGLSYQEVRIPTMVSALHRFACEGDEILSLEADLLFTGDPFDMFEWDFHIGLPQRSKWLAFAPVNVGCFGMRWTEMTRQFMGFWGGQVRFVDSQIVRRYHQLMLTENADAHRTVEEDVPNAILVSLSTEQLTILPSEYNWFPNETVLQYVDVAAEQFRERFRNPRRCCVLHFKGNNKVVMAELGGAA